jgi:hypothetical protein
MKRMVLVVTVGIVMATLLALTGPSFAASDDTDDTKKLSRTCDRYLKETNDVTLAALCEELRAETAKYKDVDEAVEHDYVAPTRPDGSLICVAPLLTEGGGMGYHYVNRDDVLNEDPPEVGIGGHSMEPEAVLYDPEANGEKRLVAVEWIVRDADQKLGTDNDPRPVLPGPPETQFQGPMPGHELWMPIHYDLHAWVWKYNSRGMFAQYNPAVDCNPSTD